MKQSAQSATTQAFAQIQDIRESIVLFTDGNASLVVQVTSVNFALLSPEEQDAKVTAYAALLNSLSFPLQILIQSKQVQIAPYLKTLDQSASSTTNEKLAQSIRLYKEFVENLVKTASVLDKKFFLVIPYSSLEGGVKSATVGSSNEDFFIKAKATLMTKADGLISQLDRLSLRSKVLEKEALTALFYDNFNPTVSVNMLDIQAMLAQLGGSA